VRIPIAVAVICLSVTGGIASLQAAEAPAAAFRNSWEGRRVVVQRPLFTLVFDELGRVGATHKNKREGLTVATPSKGSSYRFAGRQSVDDLVNTDPDRLFDQIRLSYKRNQHLQIGFTQTVTPLHLIQYVRGIELLVRRVDIERASIRFVLHKVEPASEYATTLTVDWPAPISSNFTERAEIERVVNQFLIPSP
jgi:hypothetical protein